MSESKAKVSADRQTASANGRRFSEDFKRDEEPDEYKPTHIIRDRDGKFSHILSCWLEYYHRCRPHQGLGNVPIDRSLPPPEPFADFSLDDVECHESLGGLLKHYDRKAV